MAKQRSQAKCRGYEDSLVPFHFITMQCNGITLAECQMTGDSVDSVFRNGKSDYTSEWKYVGLGGEIVESSRSICSFCFYLSGGNWRNTLWHLSTICWPAPWLKNLHLDGVARGTGWNDVQHVWKQWVFADWANGSNHENAQITETLNKRGVMTADLLNVDHKSLVDVPTPPPKTQPSYY